jgi:hypothetical protein
MGVKPVISIKARLIDRRAVKLGTAKVPREMTLRHPVHIASGGGTGRE